MRGACAYADRRQVGTAALALACLRAELLIPRRRSLDAWCTRQYDYYQRVVNGTLFGTELLVMILTCHARRHSLIGNA